MDFRITTGFLLKLAKLFLVCSLLSVNTFAQNINNEANLKNFVDEKRSWFGRNSPRVGIGMQKAFNLEIGYSRFFNCYVGCNDGSAHNIYTSFEFIPALSQYKESYYGLKIGYEVNGHHSRGKFTDHWAVGFEAKYLSNWENDGWYFFPKAGINWHELNLFYGFNILKNLYHLERVGNHQVSLIFSLRKPYWID